jgi:hypothetical protein
MTEHNVTEWEMWAGIPAKKIGDRRLKETFIRDGMP